MLSKQPNYLIIGQGLAGSLLSLELLKRGQRVLVIDDGHQSSSTKVAAGLINPITGHRWNLTENFFAYLRKATKCYQSLEQQFEQRILHPVTQIKSIKNQGQSEYFNQRINQEPYASLLEPCQYNTLKDKGFAYSKIRQSFICDVASLLELSRIKLEEKDSFLLKSINYAELVCSNQGVQLGDISAERIIFCEGSRACANPWTKHLPFKLSKGSILEVELEQENEEFLNWGRWLAPIPSSSNKRLNNLGATHIWDDHTLDINATDAELLTNSLSENTTLKASIKRHKTGVRPTTTQRKPFVGPLSSLENAYVLNGLGSKGCLIAPYYVEQLVQHLLHETPLDAEVTQWL